MMKKNQYFYIIGFIVIIFIAVAICYLTNNNKSALTESEAISLLKIAYPEFKDYPNDNLPPQRILAEKDTNGWYVAFVQLGSGRPIIGAKCFFVKNDKSIQSIGEFNPSPIEDIDFSIKTCN